MKKLIAMVMTAAMVASLVPATAFAADDVKATARIVNSWTKRDTFGQRVDNPNAPELQLKVTSSDTQGTNPTKTYKYTIELDGADFDINNDGTLSQDELTALSKTINIALDANGSSGGVASKYTYTEIKTLDATLLGIIYDKYVAGGSWKLDEEGYKAVADAKQGDANAQNSPTGTSITDTNITQFVTGLTAPTAVAGNSAEKNRDNAFSNSTDGLAHTKGWTAADYQYYAAGKYMFAPTLGDGFVNIKAASGTKTNATDPDFVPLADVVAHATGKNDTTGKPFVVGGKFVDTYEDQATKKTAWINTYLGKTVTDNVSGEDLCKETASKSIAPTGVGRNGKITAAVSTVGPKTKDLNTIEITVTCTDNVVLAAGDVISIDLLSYLDRAKTATASVKSDDFKISNDGEDLVYVSIEDEGVTAAVAKIATVAEEEKAELAKNLVIKSTVEKFVPNQVIELKLNSGFEFSRASATPTSGDWKLEKTSDKDTARVVILNATDKVEIPADAIEIEAKGAKAGAKAVLTVKATNKDVNGNVVQKAFNARTTVEVMTVCEYVVVMSVDKDKDVPVIYSGVNVANYGITDDSDHMSLEVTAKETFPGAWSMRKGFSFELPKGVYVTDVRVTDTSDFYVNASGGTGAEADKTEWRDAFWNAYQDGDHLNFKFDKRVFDDVDSKLSKDPATVSFKLELVADPGFAGDVTLKLKGDLIDEQEVKIAKFVTPYQVTAEQNDLKIDYRFTEIPTKITIKEAEDGLWDAGKASFAFYIEKGLLTFEDDPTFTVDSKSGLKIINGKIDTKHWDIDGDGKFDTVMQFDVDKESSAPAEITISNMSLYMQRSIPAGPYALKMSSTLENAYNKEILFAPETNAATVEVTGRNANANNAPEKPFKIDHKDNKDDYVGDVNDYSTTVKEAFVNVVTAGREQDDASFTTKVVVPVGEKYIIAGENKIELDVPAYINAKGYTMLPVRAVATALGINNNNVLWDQATRTVTILYGQRIITMQVGANVVSVNGSAIPASSSVEITDSRTFLGLRDLATALGVTTINWDPATKTASLN